MHAYRVFVSYSNVGFPLAQGIVGALQCNGLTAMWDQNFLNSAGIDPASSREPAIEKLEAVIQDCQRNCRKA